jgi:ribosomal protein L11 methyltransferase
VERANLREGTAPYAPTIVANLVAPVLRDVAALMKEAPERLIISGLLTGEADEVAAAFRRHGLQPADRLDSGDWSAVLLTV